MQIISCGRALGAAPPGQEKMMCFRKIHDRMVAGWRADVNRNLAHGLRAGSPFDIFNPGMLCCREFVARKLIMVK
jgi:hypothetical protein